MSASDVLVTESCYRKLRSEFGPDYSDDWVRELAGGLLLWCVQNNVNGKADWEAAAALLMRGVAAGFAAGRTVSPPRPDMAAMRRQVRELIAGIDELAWPERGETPLPPNHYLVTTYADRIMVPGLFSGSITKDKAINAAVWMIALADPTLKEAAPQLVAVATR